VWCYQCEPSSFDVYQVYCVWERYVNDCGATDDNSVISRDHSSPWVAELEAELRNLSSATVTTEGKQETTPTHLSNGTSLDDLQRPITQISRPRLFNAK